MDKDRKERNGKAPRQPSKGRPYPHTVPLLYSLATTCPAASTFANTGRKLPIILNSPRRVSAACLPVARHRKMDG